MRGVWPHTVAALERLAYLAAAALQSRDVALPGPARRPGFGGIWACGRGGSPKRGRCAGSSAHRPGFGEFRPFGRRNRPASAQDPAFGENRPLWAGEASGVPAGRRVGPSRRFSKAGILCASISPKPGRCARIARNRFSSSPNSPKPGRCAG